jgi:hypothetical protein
MNQTTSRRPLPLGKEEMTTYGYAVRASDWDLQCRRGALLRRWDGAEDQEGLAGGAVMGADVR